MGIKTISKRLSISRNTVRAAVKGATPPAYRRKRRASAVDPYEPQIKALLKDCNTMPATVITERIGWTRGMTILKDRIAEIRPLFLEPDPFQRTDYRPGELAQWDIWLPDADIPVGYGHSARLPVIVGVPGYSRVIVGRMTPSREAPDLLLGHLDCLCDLGAVPRKGVYDNEAPIGRKRRDGTVFTHEFLAFKGALGMGAVILEKGHPERKGVVERAIGYLETSFLPGRAFSSVDDFNTQLSSWLQRANARIHRMIRCRPIDRLNEDLASMLPLPPVLPDIRHRFSTLLGRDHYVRFSTCDYSVHPQAIGRRIDVTADLDFVIVTCSDEEVARHRRSLCPHRTITAVDHARARREMRRRSLDEDASPTEIDVEQHDLSDYDRALGIASMASQTRKDLTHLCRELKAPSLLASVDRLTKRARDESWPYEEFLAACLEREVASRQTHGGEARIKAARFPAQKTLEDFDFSYQRSVRKEVVSHLGTLDFVEAKDNVIFLGPPRDP